LEAYYGYAVCLLKDNKPKEAAETVSLALNKI